MGDETSTFQKSGAPADHSVLPLLEEEARIETRQITTGKVRIRTTADVVSEIAAADLWEEQVDVRRIPVDRVVSSAPAVRTEGDVTIVPVLEEVLVVQKQLVLREELHIRRVVTTEHVEVPVELRKQRASVERLEGAEQKPDEELSR